MRNVMSKIRFLLLDVFSCPFSLFTDSNDVICFCPGHYLDSSGMFACIRFDFSKSVFPRGLENDPAYASYLSSCDFYQYIYVRSIAFMDREMKTERDE